MGCLSCHNSSIIAWREGQGGPVYVAAVVSTSTSSSPSLATAAMGSPFMSSSGTSLVVDCTRGLLDELTLGSSNFFWAVRYFRNLLLWGQGCGPTLEKESSLILSIWRPYGWKLERRDHVSYTCSYAPLQWFQWKGKENCHAPNPSKS